MERTHEVNQANVWAVTLFVEDPKRSKEFYQRVLDLAPVYEDESSVAFKLENLILNLLEARVAETDLAPAAVAREKSGSRFQLTIKVDDADATCAELAGRGVTFLNGPTNQPWGMRTACFTDPDGHLWEIAQEIQ
jgi:catechol 2,3-dioxygenase-like lactoylglutathione lyase family enzyme